MKNNTLNINEPLRGAITIKRKGNIVTFTIALDDDPDTSHYTMATLCASEDFADATEDLATRLLALHWLTPDGARDFANLLFTGEPHKFRIQWLGPKGALACLVRNLNKHKQFAVPAGESMWRIIASHFADENGNGVGNLESHNSNEQLNKTIQGILKDLRIIGAYTKSYARKDIDEM